jgi:hypothetical protein
LDGVSNVSSDQLPPNRLMKRFGENAVMMKDRLRGKTSFAPVAPTFFQRLRVRELLA